MPNQNKHLHDHITVCCLNKQLIFLFSSFVMPIALLWEKFPSCSPPPLRRLDMAAVIKGLNCFDASVITLLLFCAGEKGVKLDLLPWRLAPSDSGSSSGPWRWVFCIYEQRTVRSHCSQSASHMLPHYQTCQLAVLGATHNKPVMQTLKDFEYDKSVETICIDGSIEPILWDRNMFWGEWGGMSSVWLAGNTF